jgi:hypothetical protein
MTRLFFAALAASALLLQGSSADALVGKLLEVHTERGYRIRATLTATAGGQTTAVRQLLVLGRRERAGTWTLYQQLWPDERGGRVLVTVSSGPSQLNGFVHRGGRATPLTDRMQGDLFFDSDFTLEDVAERFWEWPAARTGEESIGEYRCTIVDLRPAGVATRYGFMRAWISPEIAMALRVDQFARDGTPIKRIELFRPARLGDRWVPTLVTVEPADRRSRSVIEGSKEDDDDSLTRADFTVASVTRRLAQAPR